jgi:hypothetical protein
VPDTIQADSPQGAYLDSSYFTDGEALTRSLVDRRSTDTWMRSSYEAAQAAVNDFAARAGAGAWPSLSRADVAQRLGRLVTAPDPTFGDPAPATGPRSLQQGALNLCGPTAFFQMALGRDPLAVVNFAADLFDNGAASLGGLQVAPSQDLLQADYAAMLQQAQNEGHAGFTAAEWMLLGALRNSTDVFWQGTWTGDPDQTLSALTRPEELAGWMRACGLWASVEDNGRWATNPGIVDAANIRMDPGTDVAFLIHANLIANSVLWNPNTGAPDDSGQPQQNPAKPDNTFLLSSFPDHWVVLLSEVIPDAQQQNVLFTIWTWGQRLYLCAPNQVFLDNYYGSVIGRFPDPSGQG